MMMSDDCAKGDAEVTQQVKTIEDVLGRRRARAGALGEDVGAVASDDLDARVGAQPSGDAPGVTVRQEIADGVTFEVDDHGVVQRKVTNGYRAMWAAEGEAAIRTVVDTARLTSSSPCGSILKTVGT
ncbi:hypothetical protein SB3_24370 [Methylobacterium radiotolerans]|nr:hypothetical protein SB3_24370 [Methylobacterium radiotolerans]